MKTKVGNTASEEASINLCTVFGCLLQYPAVYWFNSEKGLCLDMEELVQHRVIVEKRNTCGSKHKVVFRGGSRGFLEACLSLVELPYLLKLKRQKKIITRVLGAYV